MPHHVLKTKKKFEKSIKNKLKINFDLRRPIELCWDPAVQGLCNAFCIASRYSLVVGKGRLLDAPCQSHRSRILRNLSVFVSFAYFEWRTYGSRKCKYGQPGISNQYFSSNWSGFTLFWSTYAIVQLKFQFLLSYSLLNTFVVRCIAGNPGTPPTII